MPPKASTSAPSSSKATGSGSTGKVAAASSTKGKAATSGSSTSGNAKASSSTSKKPAASTSKAAAANGASGSGSGSPAGSVRMTSLEHRIHQHALAANKQTLTYAELQAIEGVPEDGDALTEIINKMLRKHLLKVQKTPRGESVFVAQSMAQAREYGAMDPHDKLCLDCITSGGNQGMWTRTLKARTNLHQNLMAKALKNLEQRKLIKQVKSVKYPTRKIYMNSNVIPSIDLTGGPWYSKDGALDIEFIDALHRACKNYIKSKSFPDGKPNLQWPRSHDPYLPTANDVLEFLTVKQVIRDVELAVEHIELILNALVYDGEIERIWCRRYDADGREYAIDPAPAGLADSNGAGTKRKKGGQGGGSKKKKRRGDSADIDVDSDDTGAGSSSGSGGDEDEEDAYSEPDFDYQLPPALNGKGRKNGFRDEPAEKPHPRPGPAGNAWYWVYKTRLTGISNGSSKDPATGETVYHFPDPFDLGYTQSPCGICPVASFCNNKGTPRVLPLPGEKDLTNDGETGWEEWRTSSSVSQRVQIKDVPGKSKGKFNPNANRSDPKERMKALLKMKVPAGGGEFEDADGKWKGGGKVGGKVIAPVNPSNCLYYSSWFGEEIDW